LSRPSFRFQKQFNAFTSTVFEIQGQPSIHGWRTLIITPSSSACSKIHTQKKTEQNTQHCIVTGIQQCKRKLCRRKVSHAMSCHDLPSMLAQNRNKINGKNNDKKSGIRKAIYSTINCYSRLHNTITQVRALGTNIFRWRPGYLYIPMIRWVTLMKIWF